VQHLIKRVWSFVGVVIFITSVAWLLMEWGQQVRVVDFYITNPTPNQVDVVWVLNRPRQARLVVLPVESSGKISPVNWVRAWLPIGSVVNVKSLTPASSVVQAARLDRIQPGVTYQLRLKVGINLIPLPVSQWQAPSLATQPPELLPAYSQVRSSDGQPITNAVVLLYRSNTMQPKVMAVTDERGYWSVNAGLLGIGLTQPDLIMEVIAPDGRRRIVNISSRYISPALVVEFDQEQDVI